ncbi:TetR/AcrR family transcriptional regulator [Vibrio owensii]|uniref:TetR/AcrR family transcriptional regulator n=1 Tax=Vibrio owensii TaxID=696485 RepID=UPI003395FB23
MARISRAEWVANKKQYDALVFQMFIKDGWSAVTLDRVSTELGIRKSTLQGYYPHKDDFMSALQGKIFPLIAPKMDFSGEEQFIESWKTLLKENSMFREVLMMLITSIINNGGAGPKVRAVLLKLINGLALTVGEEKARQTVEKCFGTAIFSIAFNYSSEIRNKP